MRWGRGWSGTRDDIALGIDSRVIELCSRAGFSQKEIAEKLSIDKGTVSRKIKRAREAGLLEPDPLWLIRQLNFGRSQFNRLTVATSEGGDQQLATWGAFYRLHPIAASALPREGHKLMTTRRTKHGQNTDT